MLRFKFCYYFYTFQKEDKIYIETVKVHPLINNEINFWVDTLDYNNPYDFSKIHRHSYYEIFLIEKGLGGDQLIDFECYKLKDQSLYIIAPNQVHLLKRKKQEQGLILQFTDEFLKTSLQAVPANLLFTLKSYPETKLSKEDFETLMHSFKYLKNLYSSEESLRNEKLRHFFAFTIFQVLGIIQTSNTGVRKDNLTIQFVKLAETEFESKRNIASFAKSLNVSVTKLNAQIKKDLGKTPLQIIHELLIVEIKRLVIIEQLSHKEISHRLNFDSQSTYSRFVNKQLGCNPSELSRSLEKHK